MPQRRAPKPDGGDAGRPRSSRRFTVPEEPTLAPQHVAALRVARLSLQLAARDGSETALIPAIERYVRAACAAKFARLTVRHTVAAALLAAGTADARRVGVTKWMGYVDRLYDANGTA